MSQSLNKSKYTIFGKIKELVYWVGVDIDHCDCPDETLEYNYDDMENFLEDAKEHFTEACKSIDIAYDRWSVIRDTLGLWDHRKELEDLLRKLQRICDELGI